MRKHGKIDANQPEIVKALRKAGISVLILSDVGGGCPDLMAGHRGCNYLLEVKDGSKPPSERKLTPKEQEFFDTWNGKAYVVYSAEDALNQICT